MATVYPTESFELYAPEIGQRFHIDVALPDDYHQNPERSYPVAYTLDGNLMFHLVAMTNSLCARDVLDPGVGPAIVVGIGYPNPSELSVLRVRDYTPEGSVDDWFAEVYVALTGRKAESGGAAAFLKFISVDLHAAVAQRYRLRGETATLLGDSYGGLFSYYAFLEAAERFDRYWLGSPGVFGAGAPLLDRLPERLAAGFGCETRVSVTLGSVERHGSVAGTLPQEIYQEMAQSYDVIAAALAAHDGSNLLVDAREFADETHVSVLAPALTHAWRFLMRR